MAEPLHPEAIAGHSDQVPVSEYIQHHLHNWTVGEGFWTVNLDTIIVSLILGFAFLGIFFVVARRAKVENPGKLQNLVEWFVEFIEKQVKDIYHGPSKFVAPLALTIFVWVLLFNMVDLIPVDLIPRLIFWISGAPEAPPFRAVPSADPNMTLAISGAVIISAQIFGLRWRGPLSYLGGLFTHPFGTPQPPLNAVKIILAPFQWAVNLAMRLIDEIAHFISLGLRLFGNMYSGELIFILIATVIVPVQPFLSLPWSIFHILIVILQAYVMTVLSVVYLSSAGSKDH